MNKKIKENYEELARKLGFHFDAEGGALYGKTGAYDVIIAAENANYPYMLTATISVRCQSGALAKETCKQFKHDNKPVSALVQKGSLVCMSLKNYAKQATLQEHLYNSLNALVNLLRTEGFQNCCQTCGKENPSPCYISGSYMHLCSDCFSRVQHDNSMNSSQKQHKKENVIGGIVGALLGSLLGIASIIIFSQLGYVAALSGVIMAVCTLKGYEMLGGKLSTKGIVISSLLMLLMTAFGDRLDWAIIIARELEVDFATAFRIFPELLSNELIEMSNYVANLVIQYLFVLLGAIPTIISAVKGRKVEGRIYRLGSSAQEFVTEE